jgi:predicted nucleic acid-binding protein
MRRLFADTFYWIALLNRRDRWNRRVVEVTASLGNHHLFTTDAVFDEFLAYYSSAPTHLRQQAGSTVRRLLNTPHMTVIEQNREVFLQGLSLFEARPDKGYSLTDCISMNVMRKEGLTEVLSNDRHFAQEGFQLLFPASSV